ncbi:MAG TPA: hypothetical protein VG265_15460 [Gaiellaceae bacterium]|jgi:hypothetical protein|nr:hypothetical protein [Gaiellaceae bacterium]
MSDSELAALEQLLAANPGVQASLTRRDPGETGPVLVHIGDETHELPLEA